jgi:hypothetical protein
MPYALALFWPPHISSGHRRVIYLFFILPLPKSDVGFGKVSMTSWSATKRLNILTTNGHR